MLITQKRYTFAIEKLIRMGKTYKTNEPTVPEANEPVAVYQTTQQPQPISTTGIPDGYMSLDVFAEKFHKKLDECYAKLQQIAAQHDATAGRIYCPHCR